VVTKQAVMFGAGNIGRGFIGQLFSESGYALTFVDIDETLLAAINERREYIIELVQDDLKEQVVVAPVSALHSVRQSDEVVQRLASASIAATAVGARVLPAVAPLVAAGIRRRAAEDQSDELDIIVCENLKDAARIFRGMVEAHLDDAGRAYAQAHIGFVDTVIGRMVPPPTAEMRAIDPSLIQVEPYKELPVDRHGFVGVIPQVVGLEACDNFPVYTARKLYLHNCGHAVLAYLGFLRGHEYGYEALNDAWICTKLEQALGEARDGIVTNYKAEASWLLAHCEDLLRRFANRALGDTIFRLGRDPIRKLAPQDRLVGAARLVEKAGLRPDALSMGIAAGYCFDAAEDAIANELQEKIAAQGFEQVLREISAIDPEEPLGKLVRQHYQQLRERRWS
jgi:mannitol-1-phosphate 5-dehydrogenase